MNTKYLSSNIDVHLGLIGDLSQKAKIVKLGQQCKATELEGMITEFYFRENKRTVYVTV